MIKTIFSIATLCLLPFPLHAADTAAPVKAGKPNVLMIVIDDMNDWVGHLGGHPQVQTPCMDALAARGTAFANAHVQAPLCNPSRTSVLSGLRPSTTGIYGLHPGPRDAPMLRDWVMLPQYFAQHGYFTACYGKVYHDGAIPAAGKAKEFEVYGAAPGMPMPKEKFVNTPSAMKGVDWGVYPPDDRDSCDWKIADLGIAQLAATPANRPFFLAVGFRLPHLPIFASQKWFDLYPEDTLKLPPVFEHDRDDTPRFSWYLHWKLPEPRLAWLEKHHQWKSLVRSYLAGTSFMDSQIGRLMDALKASGRLDNTIVVLWSDHGWHLGEKAITGKNTLWERSTRVPLIFAGPGVTPQAASRSAGGIAGYLSDLGRALRPAPARRTGRAQPDSAVAIRQHAPRMACDHHRQCRQHRDPHRRLALHPLCGRFRGALRRAQGSQRSEESRRRSGTRRHQGRTREITSRQYAAPAPGSAARTLTFTNGIANWEGKDIPPDAPIPELDGN